MTTQAQQATPVSLDVTIERKRADLPRFAVVPARALAPWSLEGTTVVEMTIQDVEVERRTVKRWDAERWFLTITQKDCERIGCEVGDEVKVTLHLASATLPPELDRLLREDPGAAERWQQLTPGRQRVIREHVAEARQSVTRQRRARQILAG